MPIGRLTVLAGLCIFLFNGSAAAGCTLSDLAGKWDVYTARAQGEILDWTLCSLNISDSGAITSERRGCTDIFQTIGNVTGQASLLQASVCEFRIVFGSESEGAMWRTTVATLSQNRQAISGGGLFDGKGGFRQTGGFMLSAVRVE